MSEFIGMLNSAGAWFAGFAGRMLIQSSLLIVALVILDLVLRRRVKAVVRYWIWLLVLAKLLLPPSLSSPTAITYWIGDRLPSLSKPAEPVIEELPVSPPPVVVAVEHPAAFRAPGVEPSAAYHEPYGPGQTETGNPPVVTVTAPAVPPITWQAALLLAWAVVVLVMVVLLIQRALFVRSLVMQSGIAPERLIDLLGQCRRRMAVRRDVELRLSLLSVSPSVCGLRRLTILMPQSMLAELDATQLKSVLLHELAHIKRGDLWVNLAQALLQIAYFFHPLLWVANAIIRRVREQAVDETVLAAMGEEAEEYPETLLSVSRLAFDRPSLSLRLLGVVESKKALTARIKHIVSRPFPTSAKLGVAGLVLILATAAFLLPMAKAQPQDKKTGEAAGATQVAKTADSNSPTVNPSDKPVTATGTIEGIVTDALGRPRQCVYVASQGQRLWDGVMSDVRGRFKLESVRPDQRTWIAYSQASRLYGFFVLPETIPAGPIKAILNFGETDLEGRVVGPDGKPVASRKVEFIVSTPDGIRVALDYQPQTNSYGYYSYDRVPCGEGLSIQAQLVDSGDGSVPFSTAPVATRANQFFIEMPLLVAADQRIQPDFDRNMSDDGMLHCGGRVVDESGRPIPNVRVRLAFDVPNYMSRWVQDAMTDEQGHWRRSASPECTNVSVEFEHGEYYVEDSDGRPSREELIKGTLVTTMKRGVLFEGRVIDERGEFVENALVCGSRPSSFTPSPYNQIIEDSGMTRTLRDGTFRIRGLPPGVRPIAVYSDYHAPTVQTVDIREGMAPTCVTLKQGRTYRGRVVDARGNPMDGVRVGTQRWQSGNEQHWMSRMGITDAQGIFTIENLPEGQVEINFGKKGFLGFRKDLPQDMSPIDQAVMYEGPVFTGRVVGADANEPVRDFEIVNGIRENDDGSLRWSRYHRAHVENPDGAFTHRWDGWYVDYPPSFACCIKLEAKGYLPEVAPPLKLGEKPEPFVIRLTRGESRTGVVLTPRGQPAADAEVGWVGPEEKAFLADGRFDMAGYAYQADQIVKTGADGRFELDRTRDEGLIVIVHPDGYAMVKSTEFTNGSNVRLTAWARIEGRIVVGNGGGRQLTIAVDQAISSEQERIEPVRWMFEAVSISGNHFAIEHIPAVPLHVGAMIRWEQSDPIYLRPEPGKTHSIEIGTPGRPVTGKIVHPAPRPKMDMSDPRRLHAVAYRINPEPPVPGEIRNLTRASFQWLWRDADTAYDESKTFQKRFVPEITDDGEFTFAALAPGKYEFVLNLHAPLGENVSCGRGVLEAVAVSQFSVPDDKGTSAVRVSDVRLRSLTYPKVEEAAPLFEAKTFDGGTIKLADLRGKVVLLDFWATWCSPCVAQLPQVQEVYEAFSGNDRFTMIGMSLDWDIEKAKKFLGQRQLKWPQVSLGNMDRSPVVKQYGVGSIPTTVLIDPEGKILVMGVSIDHLKEKIRVALAAR